MLPSPNSLPRFVFYVLCFLFYVLALPACGWLAGMNERMNGAKVAAEYHGLENKSVAIVVYAAQATTDEFPKAREDISQFLALQMRLKMPTTRILNYQEIINWQDDTINWDGLTEKQIGQHFSVDRVLYVELLDYSTRMGGGYGDLQGHLRANCKIFEVDAPGNAPSWTALMDTTWPHGHPLEASRTSETTVRKRTLEIFAEDVTNKFYDHKEFEKMLNERQ
jgi:hypothetical protein